MSEKSPNTYSFNDKMNSPDDGVFCILPFVHMYIHSSEKPKVCCTFSQYGLNDETVKKERNLAEEWTSDYYRDIRIDILKGKKVEGCVRCYRGESNGGSSDRIIFNDRYKKILKQQNLDVILNIDTGNQFKSPLDLDLRPGNLCNLACRMCGPSSSTQLNKEYKKMPKTFSFEPFNEDLQSHWATSDNLEFILKHADKGKRIKFLGGEPTIMPEVHDILKLLIDKEMNTKVSLSFTSNLTNVNKNFLNIIKDFTHVDVNISMDGIDKTLEYIRHPISWNQIQKNIITYSKIDSVAQHTNSFDIQFTMQAYNIHNILDTLIWMDDMNESGILGSKKLIFSPEILAYPNFYSYKMLPKKYRDKHIINILNSDVVNKKFVARSGKTLQRLDLMLKDDTEDSPEPFIKHTVFYDMSRKQYMKNYLPELWEEYGDLYTKIREKVRNEMLGII